MPGFLNRLKTRLEAISNRSERCLNSDLQMASDLEVSSGALVTVNVYDMLGLNVYTNSLGLGVYHTGVVIYGTEYCYGGHPFSYSGIFTMVPQDCATLGVNYSYRTSVFVGRTDFTPADVTLILEDLGPQFRGDQYHLLHRNCNHFSEAFIQFLCGVSLPKWINRLATVGAKFPFVERTIPRLWLTPRPLEEFQLLSQQCMGEAGRDSPPHSPGNQASQRSGLSRSRLSSLRSRRGASGKVRTSQSLSVASMEIQPYQEREEALPRRSDGRASQVGVETGEGRRDANRLTSSSSLSSSLSSCSGNCRGNVENDSQKSRWSLLLSSCLPQLRGQPRVCAESPSGRSCRSASLVSSSKVSSTSFHCLPSATGSQDLQVDTSADGRTNSSLNQAPAGQKTTSVELSHEDRLSQKEHSNAACLRYSCTQALTTGLLVRFQSLCGVNGTGSDSPTQARSPAYFIPVAPGVAVSSQPD